jgi:signal transduction histidine kinase/ActR/RegA family two-component response regulator
MGQVFASRKMDEQALDCCRRSEDIYRNSKSEFALAEPLCDLGSAYVKSKRFDRAIDCLEKSIAIARQPGSELILRRACELLAEAHRATGNYEAAFANLKAINQMVASKTQRDLAKGIKAAVHNQKAKMAAQEATALRAVNRELRIAKEQAESTSRYKSEFLANMSHEIRTPMAGVIGLAGLLVESGLDPVAAEYAAAIKDCGESLLHVINDILDFSKIEAGKMAISEESFELSKIVRQVCNLLRPSYDAAGLRLDLVDEPRLPQYLVGDPNRIRQILMNLIGNAVKFTREGGVTVRIEMLSSSSQRSEFRLSVEDTGIGIPTDRHGAIFESFTQAYGATDRRFGGTGLGLTITKKLVELMGGAIEVVSEIGKGSSFCVTLCLPVGVAKPVFAHGSARAGEAESLLGMRILLAEDNTVNQMVARRTLERLGCEVSVCANGLEAIQMVETCYFDLVLMDCQMPVLDGYEATRRIRGSERSDRRSLPIIAMTANAMEGDRERCLEAGMDNYLSKPVDPSELLKTLIRYRDLAQAA